MSVKPIAQNSLSPWKLPGNVTDNRPSPIPDPPKSPVSGFLLVTPDDLAEDTIP